MRAFLREYRIGKNFSGYNFASRKMLPVKTLASVAILKNANITRIIIIAEKIPFFFSNFPFCLSCDISCIVFIGLQLSLKWQTIS